MAAGNKKIELTQVKGFIGRPKSHKLTAKALGLKGIGHTVVHENTPQIKGMIRKVEYLVDIKEL